MSTLEDDAKGTPFEGLLKGNGVRSEPPEDLRAAVINLIQSRNKFIVVQAKRVFDGITDPQRADENNIYLNREAADQILRLCEAAALAASPEKLDFKGMLPPDDKDPTKMFQGGEAFGNNQAIHKYQANIHSVFGGKSNG